MRYAHGVRVAPGVSALVAFVACAETIPVPIEAEPGDVVIVAATNPAGAVVATQLTDFGAPQAIALPRDATVVTWVLPRGSLIDEDGVPLTSQDDLSVRIVDPNRPDFTAGMASRDTGSCRRCLAPSGQGPQIMFKGDSCAVPRFARATGDQAPGTLTAARRQIRLERTGACPCVPHEPANAGSVALRAIQPAPDPWPYDVYAQAPDGTLGIFSRHEIILASPDGTRRRRTQQDESRYCGGAPADLPFVGSILAAVGLSDGRFLLASHDPEKEAVQNFFVVEPDLTVNLVTTNLALMRAKKMVRFDDSGDLYLFGESRRTQPAVMRCTYRPSEFQLTCEVITPDDYLAKDSFVPTAVTDDGVLGTLSPRSVSSSSSSVLSESEDEDR